MAGENCGSCRFVRGYVASLTCHRNPPWISALSDGTAFARTHAEGIWPKVKAEDWCGEWGHRTPAQPTRGEPEGRGGGAPGGAGEGVGDNG